MEEGDPESDLILGNSAVGSPCRALLKYSCAAHVKVRVWTLVIQGGEITVVSASLQHQ